MTIVETCACGATVTITCTSNAYAQSEATHWRREHRHAESVGICAEVAPMLGPGTHSIVCELKAGHIGAHSDGQAHWIRRTDSEGDA